MSTLAKKLFDFYIIRKGCSFFYGLITPRSPDEDSRRREFILNIIILGSLFLSLTTAIFATIHKIQYQGSYEGIPIKFPFFIFIIFSIIYLLSRRGYFKLSSNLLIVIYFIPTTYSIYAWGIDLPEALLAYALIITMAGILIGAKYSLLITAIISFAIILFGYLQNNSLTHPDLYWKKEMLKIEDAIVIVATMIVIMAISWLSSREIEKSLQRARRSEADLQKERDSLEIKVEERTREIRELETEKMLQMHRFAEFGKMAGGLFHNLVNPLTAALLSVDEFKRKYGTELREKSLDLEKILRNVNRMKIFTEAARKQMQNQDSVGKFSPTEEISMALETLSYKARGAKVNLIFTPQKNISKIYGNQIKFYRLMCDLISNAIDSYKLLPEFSGDRQVEIELTQNSDNIVITVKDYGCGIKKDDKDKIFQPLFTTKEPSEGTGLGLFVSKNTIEKDFGGKIELESEEGKGTMFTIFIPINIR